MGNIFGGKPKATKLPPPAAPPPTPDVSEDVGDAARKALPRGRQEAFLTGELVPKKKKKEFLG